YGSIGFQHVFGGAAMRPKETPESSGSSRPNVDVRRPLVVWVLLKPLQGAGVWTFCRTGNMLRRSEIFIVAPSTARSSSVGAASSRAPRVGKCIVGRAAR